MYIIINYKLIIFLRLFLLFRCSRLFKQNKSDFDYICCYIIEDIIKLVLETDSVGVIKVSSKHFYI